MQQATAKVKRSTPMADWLNRLGEGTDLFDGISKNLARADIKLRPAEYMVVIVAVSLGLGAVLAILARTLGLRHRRPGGRGLRAGHLRRPGAEEASAEVR